MPSTVIRRFDYDAPARRLTIEFTSGDVYAYLDVPPIEAEGMASAASKGRFFAARVRDRFAFERVKIAAP
ncbi:MAG: KTSC domain-containing protein [Brevundimonas sp.]|nr:MAG: KTSC domain-containing protein [Brevundimonas sp.]